MAAKAGLSFQKSAGTKEQEPDARFPALPKAQKAVTAAAGDVGELGDVDVQQRAGDLVLVPADKEAGDSVDMVVSVDPKRTGTACTVLAA